MKKYLIFITIFLYFTVSNIYAEDWIITPRMGIGQVKLGMSIRYIEKGFGTSYELTTSTDGSLAYFYKDYGLIFFTNNGGIVDEIKILKPGYKRTIYRTKNGIRVGSSKNEVLRAFGQSPNNLKNLFTYQGISFSFDEEDEIVDHIYITK